MALLERRRVDLCDVRADTFLKFWRPGTPPRNPGDGTSPVLRPFTIVLTGIYKRFLEMYARLKSRPDFDTLCGNSGVPCLDVRKFGTPQKFFGCAPLSV